MKMNKSLILAVDAGGTFLKAALASEEGVLLPDSFLKVAVNSDGTAEEISASYRNLAAQAKDAATQLGASVTAVSVCIPGPFRYAEGVCAMTHKYAAIFGLPMRPWFQEILGEIPIKFLHDSTAFLLGAVSGEDRMHYSRIAGTIIGTGLGFASMFDGKIFQNPQGGPGISIFARPFRGSIAEDYASKRALEQNYRRLRPDAPLPSVADIAGMARKGDAVSIWVFEEFGSALGEILRDICIENRFELLLLGGAISKSADLFLPAMKKAMYGKQIPQIRPAEDPDNAPLLGTVRAILQTY